MKLRDYLTKNLIEIIDWKNQWVLDFTNWCVFNNWKKIEYKTPLETIYAFLTDTEDGETLYNEIKAHPYYNMKYIYIEEDDKNKFFFKIKDSELKPVYVSNASPDINMTLANLILYLLY